MRRNAWAFEYLPDGGGKVCEKLSAKILIRGGEIRFKSRVMRVEKDGDWIAHWERMDSQALILLHSSSSHVTHPQRVQL